MGFGSYHFVYVLRFANHALLSTLSPTFVFDRMSSNYTEQCVAVISRLKFEIFSAFLGEYQSKPVPSTSFLSLNVYSQVVC